MPTVNSGSALRSAIQAVNASDPIITLAGTSSFSSAVTLGKQSSTNPAPVPYSGYTIQGAGTSAATSATLQDTRIFQQNIDSAFLPGTVQNLTLNYSSSSNGNALLSIESKAARTLTIKNVDFTGTTTGWDGNGNLYMSLRSFNDTIAGRLNTTFTLDNVKVSITGQNNGFTSSPTTGGSAFFHNWNNTGVVTIKDSVFDEGGFRSSFNFYNFSAPASATAAPVNLISNNTFKRTTNANVRDQGNLLGNVNATLTSNTFQDGAYVDLYGNMRGITFAGQALPSGSPTTPNTFATIAGGYGIRITETPTGGIATRTGSPVFTGQNKFTGSGVAIKYVNSSAYISATPSTHGNIVNVSNAANSTNAFDVEYNGVSRTYQRLIASGQGNDNLTFTGVVNNINTWFSADDGNDTIISGNGSDCLLGGSGNDSLRANDGEDILDGGIGNDNLIGGDGDDTMAGVAGNDVLNGGDGSDSLDGGADNDILTGGNGNDALTGGGGADIFTYASGQQSDNITDFSRLQLDQMQLGSVNFANTSSGATLDASAYQAVASLTSSTAMDLKVTELTINYSEASANTFTTAAAANGYLLFFDSTTNTSRLFYDDDWSNTTNRQSAMHLTSITTLTALTNFTNAEFREA
jgi:Ca2+-binding RTX toxin-like protein